MASHQQLADQLYHAYQNGPIAPLRDGLAPDDIDGAYAVQALVTRRWRDDGRKLVGRKIGLTAEAVRAQFNVDQPDFGALMADMEIEEGGVLPAARSIAPMAEAEIALILSRDLTGDDLSVEQIAASVDSLCAAIEIVDSRIADWKITLADTIADNGSSSFFVLSKDRKKIDGLDLYSCGMVMEINGAIKSLGAGAACMGNPLIAAQWLARTMRDAGEPLRAGDVLMTGSLGPMAKLARGDKVHAVIGGIGECSFSYEA